MNRAAKIACESGLRGEPGPDVTGNTSVVAAIAHGIGAAVRKKMKVAEVQIVGPSGPIEIVPQVPPSVVPPPLQRIEIPKHVEEMTLEGWRD